MGASDLGSEGMTGQIVGTRLIDFFHEPKSMADQTSFAELAWNSKRKVTRR
jgi:hypothetical protein